MRRDEDLGNKEEVEGKWYKREIVIIVAIEKR